MAIASPGFALLNMSSWMSLSWCCVGCPLWPPELGGGMPGSELVTCPSCLGLAPRPVTRWGALLLMPVLCSRGQAGDRASEAGDRIALSSRNVLFDLWCHALGFSVLTVAHVQSILGGSQARG